MKVLISTDVQTFRSVLRDDTSHIYFCQHHDELGLHINGLDVIDVWICEGDEVTEELLDQWLDRSQDSPKSLLVNDTKLIPQLETLSKGRAAAVEAWPKREQSDASWVVATLRAAEMLYARAFARPSVHDDDSISGPTKTIVLIIGAGIMNLVAAEFLAFRGFQVRVVDANPDPCTCQDWTRFGATHGGGDARMFAFTEADNYNERGSDIYHDMRHVFRKTTLNGGWSVKSPTTFNAAEAAWVTVTYRQAIALA
jgi:D-amino-acid dehydrogenase